MPCEHDKGAIAAWVQRRTSITPRGRSSSATNTGWELGAFGERRLWGELTAAFQCLEGLQEGWGGTLCQGGVGIGQGWGGGWPEMERGEI